MAVHPLTSLKPPTMELEPAAEVTGSPACSICSLGGLCPPLNSAEDRKGPLRVNVSTPAFLQESFH